MAQTIADLLNSVEAESEKTASFTTNAAMEEIEKLSAACGLTEEINNSSASPEGKQTKEASMSMHDLFVQMNPESAMILGGDQEKTAELEKEAAEVETAMGELAHDVCVEILDGHIEKLASALVEAHGDKSTPHPQEVETNEDKSHAKINTTPQIDVNAMKPGKEGEVGEQKMLKAAALRKAAILAQLED